ncbi:MAG: hypothetical protein ACYC6O_07575 [Thermoleophilia bacterium]
MANHQEDEQQRLLRLVNKSGFPLQLALEHLLDSGIQGHRGPWHLLSGEHPWANEEANNSGFIDLIIEDRHQVVTMIIECKRVRDCNWIFLVDPDSQDTTEAIVWLTRNDLEPRTFDWRRGHFNPRSPQAAFCIVQGQDEQRPLLERIAGELADATEAVAIEEQNLAQPPFGMRVYIPVIVTTACLQVFKYDPAEIQIATGEFNDADFETVPFVRFRKSLSLRSSRVQTARDIPQSSLFSERTIYVVNSSHITEFLRDWNFMESSRWIALGR